MHVNATKDFVKSPHPDVPDEEVVALVRKYFDVPDQSPVDVRKSARSASVVWRVSVSDRARRQEFFVKSAGRTGAERQTALVNRADAVLANSPGHIASEIYFDPQYNLVVSRGVSGQTIASLMQTAVKLSPMRWYGELEQATRAAGAWLKLYHRDKRPGSISEGLAQYVESRKYALARLTPESRTQLFRLIGQDVRDELVVTHGDYAPENILWNGQAIGVIDFGLREWTEMSPHWDTITFVTMLDRFSVFSLRSPLFWCRPLLHRLKRGFLDAYGAAIPAERRSVQACLAVRHFSFAFGSSNNELDRRALWHLRQMERILARSEFSKDGVSR